MKKLILSVMLLASAMGTAFAQETDSNVVLNPNRPLSSGELFQGMSRAIPNGRVVLPYGLDVTFDKTVHLIFPLPFAMWTWVRRTSLQVRRRMRRTYCA